jgi:CRP-like cAMP-binding protein
MEKDIALLMETELFRDLKPEEIRNVLKIARHVEFEAEDIIMSEGDFGDTLYVILEGTVEVVKSLTMIELYDD